MQWWDGVELWLVQLPYPVAVTLVLAVLLPVFWALARLVDRGIDEVAARLTRAFGGESADPASSARTDQARSEAGEDG
jgi:hypothetical protein